MEEKETYKFQPNKTVIGDIDLKLNVFKNNEDYYNTLSDTDKEIYNLVKNSLLEIFPQVENQNKKLEFDDMSRNIAENFAFVMMRALNKLVTEKIQPLITQEVIK